LLTLGDDFEFDSIVLHRTHPHHDVEHTRFDDAFHISRDRSYDEFLPWSIVDSGLSFEFLKEEHEKSQASLSSKPCPAVEKCTTCGVCPSTWLADAPEGLIQIQPLKVRESLAAGV